MLIPAVNYEGLECATKKFLAAGDNACCVTFIRAGKEAEFPNPAKEEAFLHTLDDGMSRQDYSYTADRRLQPQARAPRAHSL